VVAAGPPVTAVPPVVVSKEVVKKVVEVSVPSASSSPKKVVTAKKVKKSRSKDKKKKGKKVKKSKAKVVKDEVAPAPSKVAVVPAIAAAEEVSPGGTRRRPTWAAHNDKVSIVIPSPDRALVASSPVSGKVGASEAEVRDDIAVLLVDSDVEMVERLGPKRSSEVSRGRNWWVGEEDVFGKVVGDKSLVGIRGYRFVLLDLHVLQD
jgi:hypothetical protein